MAKINIAFNNTNFQIDESAFADASAKLQYHLSNTMNGTGATITLGGTSYNVDSAKLTSAKNAFVSHLGTVSGSGSKVVVGGVEYSIDSAKMNDAITELHTVLGGLHSVEASATFSDGVKLSWDELKLAENGAKYGYDATKITDTSIGFAAFKDCTNLTSINIHDSVTSIDGYAFCGCNNLTSVNIPDSVTSSIGSRTFNSCTNLTSVNIPDSVTSIGSLAFRRCTNLPSITIPDSVTSIGGDAFSCCEQLDEINFVGTTEQWNAITLGQYWNYDISATYVQCSDGQVAL